MIRVGTDLVRIERLQSHLRPEDSFVRRTFTALEIELSAGRAASLAGRWAVKEAVLKALGVGITVPLTDIEVDADDLGRPVLHVHGVAAQHATDAGITHWAVSISHDGEYAIAVAIGSASG